MSKSVRRVRTHPPKGHWEHQIRARDGPRTCSGLSSAARSRQMTPKGVPNRIWRPFLVDVKPPKSRQETPKSSQKEPKKVPKRFQNHICMKNVLDPMMVLKAFWGSLGFLLGLLGVSSGLFGASTSTKKGLQIRF